MRAARGHRLGPIVDLALRDLISKLEERIVKADAVIAQARETVAQSRELQKMTAQLPPPIYPMRHDALAA